MVLVWVVWVALCLGVVEAYIETVIVSGCQSCRLRLTCRHLTSVIAILEADFIQGFNESAMNDSQMISTSLPPYHSRQALNRRCSGVNHCSFILDEDCPGAAAWGPGTLTVKYVCVSEDHIHKFCNSEILLPDTGDPLETQGFIHNPGYPRFYSSQRDCRWKIRAQQQQQRIKFTVLDIAVAADRVVYPDECSDRLEFVDSGQVVQVMCRPQEPPLEVVSEGDFMEVVLVSRHSLTPLRGVFVHYTAVGCPTVEAPEDGYLVYRNESAAEYSCCVNRVFEDDGRKTKVIHCLGARWDIDLPLPNCTRKSQQKPLLPLEEIKQPPKVEMASDILAPALLIAALFLINLIVLFYIYKIKQKHAIEFADEELGTLPLSNDDKTSP